LAHDLLITEALIVYAMIEELVEVEIVLHEEAYVARLELHGLVTEYLRVWPHIDVERAGSIG